MLTYVEHGVCDLGVVGKDTIAEGGGSFYEVLDLGFGRCRFALAAPKGSDFFAGYTAKTVASKYPNVTRAYFDKKNMDVRIIKIEGSVELAERKRSGGSGGCHADFRPPDCEYGVHEAAQAGDRNADRGHGTAPVLIV